jgi:hypothetical protein
MGWVIAGAVFLLIALAVVAWVKVMSRFDP